MASTDNKTNRFIISGRADDEFYTLYETIDKELCMYDMQFNDKIVYCNCDNLDSNFVKYFICNFDRLKLKKLYVSSLNNNLIIYDGNCIINNLLNNGDMFNEECIDILKQSDIVVTNPPFSLNEKLILKLIELNKQFLLLSNNNIITHKKIFPLLCNHQIWLGYTLFTGTYPFFIVPDKFVNEINGHYREVEGVKQKQVNNVCWLTNILINKNNVLQLHELYNNSYVKYDTADILNCDLVKNIPVNYNEPIGVPITILKYMNPEGFIECSYNNNLILYKIIGIMSRNIVDEYNFGYPIINGKKKFVRLILKKI